MKRRRRAANGEGTLVRRADGRWQASLDMGWKGGKHYRPTVYGHTEAECRLKLQVLRETRRKGIVPSASPQTVQGFLARWLEGIQPTVKPRTYEAYSDKLRLYVLPALGRLRLTQLGPERLQRLYAHLLTQGLSPTTVRHAHMVLHRALGQAKRWGLLEQNITELVDPPRMATAEMRVLSPAQARTFLHAAQGDRLEALYVLAVTTGLRQGELLGLRWQDVELEQGILRIQKTLQDGRLTDPKTPKSRRAVDLPEMALAALKAHRTRQIAERLKAGTGWLDSGLVFVTSTGTALHPSNLTRRSFQPLLARAGLPPMRFHDLRHTSATLLLAAGVHPKIVSERLGHMKVDITLDRYSHVLPTLQRQAAIEMDRILTTVADNK